jgi:hypothetical protein
MSTAWWYGDIIIKAKKEHTSLEDGLINNGLYLFHQKDTLDYFIFYGPQHFSRMISNDPKWMVNIREKAASKGISVEEMLKLDALYIFRQNYPGLFKLNQGLEAVEKRIYTQPEILDSLNHEAAFYKWDPASFIRIKAWQIYQEEEIQRTCKSIMDDPAWLEHVR